MVLDKVIRTFTPKFIGEGGVKDVNLLLVKAGRPSIPELLLMDEADKARTLHALYVPYLYNAYTDCQRLAILWYHWDLPLPDAVDSFRRYKLMYQHLGVLLAKVRVTPDVSTNDVRSLRRLVEWTRLAIYNMHKGRFGPQVLEALLEATLLASTINSLKLFMPDKEAYGTSEAQPNPETDTKLDVLEEECTPTTSTNWATRL